MGNVEKQEILVVDDCPTVLRVIRFMLAKHGFSISTAGGGEEALATARQEMPALILLDIEMPGIDGFETCRRLKADERLAHIPVLFISSFLDTDRKVKAFKAGAVDYIAKPVKEEELVAHVETHLQLKHLQEQLYLEIIDKKRLIHILCHDVANPLTCISGWAEMMSMDPALTMNKKQADRLLRILKASYQAADIINHAREIDKLSERLNRPVKEWQPEPVVLKEVVEDTLAVFANRLQEKNITFLTIPSLDGLDTAVLAEKVSFSTNVFNSIFSNAVKFSHPGSVITLVVDELNNQDTVRIKLRDEGIGIPRPYLRDIFSAGHTNSRTGTAGEKGSGLGLLLVKKYMDAYGGTISIDSRTEEEFPGEGGTEITLFLKSARQEIESGLFQPISKSLSANFRVMASS